MYHAAALTGGTTTPPRYSGDPGGNRSHRSGGHLLPPAEHVARLRQNSATGGRGRPNPLPKWRLKRVEAFVADNLESRLSLQALATVAGVSRMYFAAQFRQATGMRPHDYVTEQRISAARAMLADRRRPIVDVALSVGFQTQSHFTSVFRNRVGLTPSRFRQAVASAG